MLTDQDLSEDTRQLLRRTAVLLANAHDALPRPRLTHVGACGARAYHNCRPNPVVRSLELLSNGDVLAYCCRRHVTPNDPDYRAFRVFFGDLS